MDSLSGARRVVPRSERRHWQTQLIGHIITASTFARVVESLRPFWERARQELIAHEVVSAETIDIDEFTQYEFTPAKVLDRWFFQKLWQVSQAYPFQHGQNLPCLTEYLTALDAALCTLRLVWDREPAAWAREHLHHAVNPKSAIEGPNDGGGQVQSRTVTINLYEGGGWVVDFRGKRGLTVVPESDPVGFTEPFWEGLREIARRAAFEAVDDLKACFEHTYQQVRYEAAWGHPSTEETGGHAAGFYLYCETLAQWLKDPTLSIGTTPVNRERREVQQEAGPGAILGAVARNLRPHGAPAGTRRSHSVRIRPVPPGA